MTIQYLLVTFPEQCNVLADGAAVGVTNHVLMLPGDEYQITLSSGSCSPSSQDIALVGTSLVKPLVVAFNEAAEGLTAAAANMTPLAKAPKDRTEGAAVAPLLRSAKALPTPVRKAGVRPSKPATKARTKE